MTKDKKVNVSASKQVTNTDDTRTKLTKHALKVNRKILK